MKKYSDYFKTLHDETEPTGNLGRGTHYSVVRSLTWKDQYQTPLQEARNHDLAIVWDEDHDERVFELIELIYQQGLLSSAIIVGERKGSFSLIVNKESLGGVSDEWLHNYSKKIEDLAQSLDDPWSADVYIMNVNTDRYIINDHAERVSLYLNNLNMLWNLGVSNTSPRIRSRSGDLDL